MLHPLRTENHRGVLIGRLSTSPVFARTLIGSYSTHAVFHEVSVFLSLNSNIFPYVGRNHRFSEYIYDSALLYGPCILLIISQVIFRNCHVIFVAISDSFSVSDSFYWINAKTCCSLYLFKVMYFLSVMNQIGPGNDMSEALAVTYMNKLRCSTHTV